ncbi:heterocyst differentiation protein [Trichormus variabilis ATCC 29413]|uniref:Heterocyst differentiation protein n=2 Tax=Anabaena variabilis TaxID=264691 RepID=Q3ME64_TRIV2|nr:MULTISPECIES: HetP family heterocyst commitment protein [Nostocaceae]ABA20722.1 heterocyst differentiation protein [Trichormus variabilis ATCC 29413]MBC1217009.1 HetP family heterocyst commitment protein [Trichormus variabilis ARAD]MBC1257618.1 HetP family heterocyst commitment protein [Trichormus variabilis V5]MBC1269368.1 HetP family heterocyst commitment protein [Trichormus variabilis FSR]MBC1305146.1 HetP family heterocyst commitment protein [Trichormus variabilis N2B]
MNQNTTGITNYNKAINPQQFDKVVEAILAGKYSWACVLMLRFAGYNPMHYIPYRTYNRLLKENSEASKVQQPQHDNLKNSQVAAVSRSNTNMPSSCLSKIKDLAYLEVVGKQTTEIHGGNLDQWLTEQVHEFQDMYLEPQAISNQDITFKLSDLDFIHN